MREQNNEYQYRYDVLSSNNLSQKKKTMAVYGLLCTDKRYSIKIQTEVRQEKKKLKS